MAPNPDTKELRLDMGRDHMAVLDAMALLEDKDRTVFVRQHLERMVDEFLHRHSLAGAILHGNPLLAAHERKGGA